MFRSIQMYIHSIITFMTLLSIKIILKITIKIYTNVYCNSNFLFQFIFSLFKN